jgi:hypothetical protein
MGALLVYIELKDFGLGEITLIQERNIIGVGMG